MSITFDNLELRHGAFSLNADLRIDTGSRVALLGPSGGGKSTLLSALAGFHTPHQGRVLVDDADLTDLAPAKRPVTLLFQDHNLFPHLSAEQNIGLGLRPNLKLSSSEHQVVQEALARVGLKGQGRKRPAEMSGGQQQRVALARALLRDRPILLLDEPFAALGPALKREMFALVDEILDGTNTTMIMVTHQPEDAAAICDQVIVVAEGTAEKPVKTATVLRNPPRALAEYLGK